eukprot:5198264-Amphidinium_carterae.2
MENDFGQSIIQVDNEPAILKFAQQAAQELTVPWTIFYTCTSRTRSCGRIPQDTVCTSACNTV